MSIRNHIFTSVFIALMPMAASAIQLDFPGNATLTREKIVGHGSYHMPISAWNNGVIKTIKTEGEITKQAWKISATGLTSLQIIDPLKQQLTDAGFEVVFECETDVCGGFDFRFETDVMAEPAMHVDLGDYRFLATRHIGGETPEYISLLVSRSQNAGYVQLMRVGASSEDSDLVTSTKNPELTTISEEAATPLSNIPLERALEENGHFILDDLVFETGSSELGGGEFTSLVTLSEYLKAHPSRVVVLVGHTDSVGALANNIALSKKRAKSVVNRLVSEFGIDKSRISAEGNGYLSPRATNLTEDGRAQNRRVEVIVTSTR